MTAAAVLNLPISSDVGSNASSEVDSPASSSTPYTPVARSVELVSTSLRSNARLQSALATLSSYLPVAVTESAVASATQIQLLSNTYATPIVTKVDDHLSNAIVKILAAPAYGSAKVQQADSLAFSITPEVLKPAYTGVRTRTLSAVNTATERVVALKRQRGDPLWERLTTGLDQLSKNIATMRAALAEAGTNAVATAHVGERLAELQSKVTVAITAARAKGAQARQISQDLLANVTEHAHALTAMLESSLTEQQAQIVRNVWSKVLETVSTVRETLHISGSAASSAAATGAENSPVASRANSSAAFEEIDEVDGKEVSGNEHILTESEPISEPGLAPAAADVAAGEDANGNGVASNANSTGNSRNSKKKQKREQQAAEEKQKQASEL